MHVRVHRGEYPTYRYTCTDKPCTQCTLLNGFNTGCECICSVLTTQYVVVDGYTVVPTRLSLPLNI